MNRKIQLQYFTFWKCYQLLYTIILPFGEVSMQLPKLGHWFHTSSWHRIHVCTVIMVQIIAFGKIKRVWKDLQLSLFYPKAFSDNVFIFARFPKRFSVNNAMDALDLARPIVFVDLQTHWYLFGWLEHIHSCSECRLQYTNLFQHCAHKQWFFRTYDRWGPRYVSDLHEMWIVLTLNDGPEPPDG